MRRPVLLIVILLIPPVAAGVVSRLRTDMRYPHRFTEVVRDGLYRGGRPTAENVRNLAEDKYIHTIVNLTDVKDIPEERDMLAAISQLKINLIRLPMPGDGVADFPAMDCAADALADKKNWPVYFHCAAGKQRSNAVQAAYRIKHCGWSAAQALAELARDNDLDVREERKLCDHIAKYAEWSAAIHARPSVVDQSVIKQNPAKVP